MVWTRETSNGYETSKTRHRLKQYIRGKGVDVGCGPDKIDKSAIGVDVVNLPEVDIIADAKRLDFFPPEYFDYVFSSHTLEDIDDTRRALLGWWRILKTGGFLILYLPDKRFYPVIGTPGANIWHKHDFISADIVLILRTLGKFEILQDEVFSGDNEYSFLLVVKKISGYEFAADCPCKKDVKILEPINQRG